MLFFMSKVVAIRTFITKFGHEKSGHEKLWLAVIEKFLIDSIRGRDTLVQDYNEGFLFACDMAGLSPSYLRGLLNANNR
jgi:hypothetical protein